MLSATYEDGDTVRYAYDNSGTLATVSDSASGIKATYGYDYVGRLSVYKEQGGDNSLTLDYSYYVSNKQLKTLREVINGHVRGASYIYDDDTRLTSYQKANGKRAYTYDGFDRVSGYTTTYKNTGGTFGTVLTTGFTYASSAVSTTSSRVSGLRQVATGYDTTYSYTYDANGNILSVSDGTNTTSYVYDSANQLVRENNQDGGFTHIWVYDNAGNIQSRSEYAYTTGTIGEALDTVVYNYGDSQWGDLLTGYDGRNITSDAIGNPLSDGIRSYTWEHGRQLATVTQNGVIWGVDYDTSGMRCTRTNGQTRYEYVYHGSQLSQMKKGSEVLSFTYGANGTPLTVTCGGVTYYYVTNLQGDVVGLLNGSGVYVVQYTYDAWGNPLSTTGTMADTLGVLNPLRYRGYVYDTEWGLYYLQSRYYDPEIGRFINADVFASTGQGFAGNNMFAYCLNNPVCMIDISGEDAVYVVDYSLENGLPVFGHAYVYIQDENGDWYKTEYAGQFPDPRTARIYCYKVKDMTELNDIANEKKIQDKKYIYIEGDFSESLVYAQKKQGTNYGGYNPFTNNCLHYVRKVLLKGDFDKKYRQAIRRYREFVPSDLYLKLEQLENLYDIFAAINHIWEVAKNVYEK